MSGEMQVQGVYNPKGIDCMVCGRPDCEHFAIEPERPEDSRILAGMRIAFRALIEKGLQPFFYAPYVPLYYTNTSIPTAEAAALWLRSRG